jgi:hypothetical protein
MKDILNPPIGLFGVGDGQSGISAFLQHHLVGVGTHFFAIGYSQGCNFNIPCVFESDQRVGYALWSSYISDTKYNMRLYSLIGATEQEIKHALDYCIKEFLGLSYGYTQWLWFPYHMFCEKILRLKNVDKQKNWFKNWIVKGMVCDELFWWLALAVSNCDPQKWAGLRLILDQYNPDALTSRDVWKILESNPKYFKLEFERMDEVLKSY